MEFKQYSKKFLHKKGLFLFSTLAVFMVLCAAYMVYFNIESQRIHDNHRELLVDKAKTNINALRSSVERRLDQIEFTVFLLVSDRDLVANLPDQFEKNRNRINDKWMSLMEHERIFSSFRLMSEDGWEKIHINYDPATNKARPSDELIYKGDQEFFLQATELMAGEVGATRIELDAELGRPILPYKPRFRYFSPLEIDDVRYGSVAVSINLESFERELLSPFEGKGVPMELFNNDGFYLSSPHQSLLYGHLIKSRKEYNFSQKFPVVWATMLKEKSGTYEHNNTTYVFSRSSLSMEESIDNFSVIVSKIDEESVFYAAQSAMAELEAEQPKTLIFILGVSLFFARWIVMRDHYRALQRMQTAAMRSMSAISITDMDGNIEFVNEAFTEITGYSKEEVLGKNRNMVKSGRQDAAFYKAFWRDLKKTGSWRGEVVNKCSDGSLMTEMMSINAIEGENGHATHYVASFMDITPQKRLEEELMRLSMTDSLTGCWNKRRFDQELEREVALFSRYEGRHPPLSMAMLDIDYFKKINDTYGHDIGDKAIRQFTEILQEQLRDVDLLARVGGEEFAILMPNTNSSAAWVVAERIREAVEKQTEEPSFTCSIGISSFNCGHTKESFIKSTDMAMYQAKENGRNQVMSLLKANPATLSSGVSELSGKIDESKKALDIRVNRLPLKLQFI